LPSVSHTQCFIGCDNLGGSPEWGIWPQTKTDRRFWAWQRWNPKNKTPARPFLSSVDFIRAFFVFVDNTNLFFFHYYLFFHNRTQSNHERQTSNRNESTASRKCANRRSPRKE